MKATLMLPLVGLLGLTGCQSAPREPIDTVYYVDLKRFMGDWYVIANIPTFIERNAHNAIESYELADDGTVRTTFTFREAGFGGELRRIIALLDEQGYDSAELQRVPQKWN